LDKQIGKARESYQLALERAKSNPTLAASAQFGLGLCEEEVGRFDQAATIYREIAQKPEYAGTVGQAAATYRLTIMDDFKTPVVFKPAPPPVARPTAPTIQLTPGGANAGAVVPVPPNATPAAPADGTATTPAPAPAPVPIGPALPPETNKPAGG